jgi:hypothetical protein
VSGSAGPASASGFPCCPSSGRHEVRALRSLDKLPSERFGRDVLAVPEGTEKIRYRPARKPGSDLVEEGSRNYSYPLGHHMVHGEPDHRVPGVAGLEKLAERGGQKGSLKTLGQPFPERYGRLPDPVPAKREGVALIQGVHEILARQVTHPQQDPLGPAITVRRDP